eukprot:TRINITY_DN4127_c0_g1_i1.p1 TRINITY_DN4127_c0_g1~~TRINITY_DN4127_c0_g1_i1.p1  ORF type:complete len:53 (-),score=20.50 TRINITY_DN4127_c0_g1_i1:100-258(-)
MTSKIRATRRTKATNPTGLVAPSSSPTVTVTKLLLRTLPTVKKSKKKNEKKN